MKIYVVDTETTGLEPDLDSVCEVAATPVVCDAEGLWRVEPGDGMFVNPGRHIPPEASGIHHIVDKHVVGAPSLKMALAEILPTEVLAGKDKPIPRDIVLAAHNAPFDMGFLSPYLVKVPVIDTYRAAIHIWRDAPNYKNQTLRYYLNVELPEWAAPSDIMRPHSALFDTAITACILTHMLELESLDRVIALSKMAIVLKTVNFGEHFGKPWSEVPTSYLEWAEKRDFDFDKLYTIRHELSLRRSQPQVTKHGE